MTTEAPEPDDQEVILRQIAKRIEQLEMSLCRLIAGRGREKGVDKTRLKALMAARKAGKSWDEIDAEFREGRAS